METLEKNEKEFLDHVNKEVADQFEQMKKGMITQDQFEAGIAEKTAELTAALETQGMELKKIKETQTAGKRKSFAGQVMDSYKANLDTIKGLKNSGGMVTLDTKAAGAMMVGSSNTAGTQSVVNGEGWLNTVDPVWGTPTHRNPYLRNLVTTLTSDSHYIKYVDMTLKEGAPANIAEGVAKPKVDYLLTVNTQEMKKIAAHTRVSEEMLADVPFMESHIRNELTESINEVLEDQLLDGAGTTIYLRGILKWATAFSVTSSVNPLFFNTIENANRMDVLRTAIAIIQTANFNPTAIILNPADSALIDMNKLNTGAYELPAYLGINGVSVKGVQVIENAGVTAGTFLVGDFKKSNLVVREDMSIRVGYDGNDFSMNLVSIIAELRAAHYIKTSHAGAFVKGTFSTAVTMIDKPTPAVE